MGGRGRLYIAEITDRGHGGRGENITAVTFEGVTCALLWVLLNGTGMDLKSLLVCSDDRAVRVLRNVLTELEIHVEQCSDYESGAKKLAQSGFEAIIIDSKDDPGFELLRRLRSGKQNNRSVAIAIIDARTKLQAAFELGANFVIYEPISTEKAKSSFRAARALMKRERRRSMRVDVNIAAYFRFPNGDGERGSISGLSEGGMSVRLSSTSRKKTVLVSFCFALPDTTTVIEASGSIAWQDERRHAGIQFATLPEAPRESLKEWLRQQAGEKHDPPIRCTLLGLSPAGCFLRTPSPFPVHTRVELLLRAADRSLKTGGKVRLMEPEFGMGVEFFTRTDEHRRRLEELVRQMIRTPDAGAEVLVEPEGIDWEEECDVSTSDAETWALGDIECDRLLELFRTGSAFSREQLVLELEKCQAVAASLSAQELKLTEQTIHQRREPRIEVSLPVQLWVQGQPDPANASLVDVSHRGARIGSEAFHPRVGEVVHLVSDGCDLRFHVIWVGAPGTPQEGRIGLQSFTTDN
jgi:DNA-binding NarL/FixJ family response regulator